MRRADTHVFFEYITDVCVCVCALCSQPVAAKMMLSIAAHFAQNEPSSLQLSVGPNAGAPNMHALFARLLTFAATLDWMGGLAERSLQLLLVVAPQLHPALPRLWSNHVPKLIDYLRSCAPALCGEGSGGKGSGVYGVCGDSGGGGGGC